MGSCLESEARFRSGRVRWSGLAAALLQLRRPLQGKNGGRLRVALALSRSAVMNAFECRTIDRPPRRSTLLRLSLGDASWPDVELHLAILIDNPRMLPRVCSVAHKGSFSYVDMLKRRKRFLLIIEVGDIQFTVRAFADDFVDTGEEFDFTPTVSSSTSDATLVGANSGTQCTRTRCPVETSKRVICKGRPFGKHLVGSPVPMQTRTSRPCLTSRTNRGVMLPGLYSGIASTLLG